MKSKPSQSKRVTSLRSIDELELDNDRVCMEHNEKRNFLPNLKLKNKALFLIQLSLLLVKIKSQLLFLSAKQPKHHQMGIPVNNRI